jgi:hypothetical protein
MTNAGDAPYRSYDPGEPIVVRVPLRRTVLWLVLVIGLFSLGMGVLAFALAGAHMDEIVAVDCADGTCVVTEPQRVTRLVPGVPYTLETSEGRAGGILIQGPKHAVDVTLHTEEARDGFRLAVRRGLDARAEVHRKDRRGRADISGALGSLGLGLVVVAAAFSRSVSYRILIDPHGELVVRQRGILGATESRHPIDSISEIITEGDPPPNDLDPAYIVVLHRNDGTKVTLLSRPLPRTVAVETVLKIRSAVETARARARGLEAV